MFKHLIGNDLVKHTLKLLFSNGRVPNSFCLSVMKVWASVNSLSSWRGFLCLSDGSDGACGVCPACVRVGEFDIPAAGDNKKLFEKVFHSKHGDVAMAVPFKNFLLVDAVRDLEREANFLPFEGKARFFIVDDADKMNDQAANAAQDTRGTAGDVVHLPDHVASRQPAADDPVTVPGSAFRTRNPR